MRLSLLFALLFLISCSKDIFQKKQKHYNSINKYEHFSPTQFAEKIGHLQCEYHHLSFEIIKGNSDDLEKAEGLNQEITDVFELVQNKYIHGEHVDSASFLLFQNELRSVYDSCITQPE